MKNWLLGKETDAGKDWKWEEKGTTEDEMVGWHHQLYGHEFEQVPGVGDGQRSLVCLVWWDSMGSQRVGHDWVTELNWGPGVYAFLSVFLRVLRSWAKPPVGQFNPKYGAFGKPHWDLFQGIHEGKALRDNGGDGQLEKSETYICLWLSRLRSRAHTCKRS